MSEVLRKNVLKTLNKCIGKYIYINEDKILFFKEIENETIIKYREVE